jgi:hypothetical protein
MSLDLLGCVASPFSYFLATIDISLPFNQFPFVLGVKFLNPAIHLTTAQRVLLRVPKITHGMVSFSCEKECQFWKKCWLISSNNSKPNLSHEKIALSQLHTTFSRTFKATILSKKLRQQAYETYYYDVPLVQLYHGPKTLSKNTYSIYYDFNINLSCIFGYGYLMLMSPFVLLMAKS